MSHKLLASCPLTLSFTFIIFQLVGCMALAKNVHQPVARTDPSSGGLLQTLNALETGLYERHLQWQRAELGQWQNESHKQQQTAKQLHAEKTRASDELAALTQATNNKNKQIENKKQSIRVLNQEHIKLMADIKALEFANQQLGQKIQTQLRKRPTEQQRFIALVTERDHLRQAFKAMLKDNSSPDE